MKALNGSARKDLQWKRERLARDAFSGQKVAVIGGTNGIGRALALGLAEKGADVLVVGRSFRDQNVPRVGFMKADLTLMKDTLRTARALPAESLDMLIVTAGIMATKHRESTPEGIELDLAVSYLNRFIMLREIAERIGKARAPGSSKPRVFVWGFPGTNQKGNLDDFNSECSYSLMTAHSNTVVGNEALVLDCAARYPHFNIYGMNPGLIVSGIRSATLGEGSFVHKLTEKLIGALYPSAEQYAETMLPLLASPDIEAYSGAMFGRKGDAILPSSSLQDQLTLQKVIDESRKLSEKALAA